jgi:DNA-binding transcriptional ArsR family regulator
MKHLEKILKGFANRRRLAIVKLLLRKKQPLSVGQIADAISLSFTATSKHLNILRHLDILERHQVGLTIFYRIADSLPHAARALIPLISNSRE